jgi:hypothetical protein
VAVIPAIGADLMGRTWMAISAHGTRRTRATTGQPAGRYACSLVPEHGRIGVPMGLETHLRMPLADFDALPPLAPRPLSMERLLSSACAR